LGTGRIALVSLTLGLAACSAPLPRDEPTVAYVASKMVLEPAASEPVEVPMLVPLARRLVSMNVRVTPGPRPAYLYTVRDGSNREVNVRSLRSFEVGECVHLSYARSPSGELDVC